MCQGHVDWERLDELVEQMLGRDPRMIRLLLVEARRILDDDQVRGRTARRFREVVRASTEERG